MLMLSWGRLTSWDVQGFGGEDSSLEGCLSSNKSSESIEVLLH